MTDGLADPVTVFNARWGARLPTLADTAEWLAYTMRGGVGSDPSQYDGSIQALRLLFHGRWGNYVLEIMNMCHVAEMTGAKKIYLYQTELFPFPDVIEINGMQIYASHVDDDPGDFCLTGNYFAPGPFGALTANLDADRRTRLAQLYVRPLLAALPVPPSLIASEDLLIHIRSGDIFQGEEGQGGANFGGNLYVQPPLNFYLATVRRAFANTRGKVFIISENALNPVILPLVKALDDLGYGVTLRLNQDLATDLGWLFAGAQVAFANGTIGIAIALLSQSIRTAYFFRRDCTGADDPVDAFLGPQPATYFMTDTDQGYIAVGNWKNTGAQRRQMIDFPAERLGWTDCWGDGPVAPDIAHHFADAEEATRPPGRDVFDEWIGEAGRAYADAVWKMVSSTRSFATFRRDPAYNVVLEHLSEGEGQAYLQHISDPNILEICAASERADTVGSPRAFRFNGALLSPSTLRYAKVMADIADFFPDLNSTRSIIEIGGGYGGQARMVSEYARKTGWDLKRYTLVDLPPVAALSRLYLEHFDILPMCEFITSVELDRDTSWDFAVSNFAFSMFSRALQDKYMDRVLRKSKSGYLTMNTGLISGPSWTAEELLTTLPNAVLRREEPRTGGMNYVVTFGDHAADIGLRPGDLV